MNRYVTGVAVGMGSGRSLLAMNILDGATWRASVLCAIPRLQNLMVGGLCHMHNLPQPRSKVKALRQREPY